MTLAHADCSPLIRRREPFKAGNVYAEIKNGLYVAYSYGEHFPMAVHTEDGWVVNTDKFSPSTTRQQYRTRVRDLPGAKLTNTEECLEAVRRGSAEHQRQQLIDRGIRRLTR